MTTHNYHNDATQAERKAIVKNDSYITSERKPSSLALILMKQGGRFKKETRTPSLARTPRSPIPGYPQARLGDALTLQA